MNAVLNHVHTQNQRIRTGGKTITQHAASYKPSSANNSSAPDDFNSAPLGTLSEPAKVTVQLQLQANLFIKPD